MAMYILQHLRHKVIKTTDIIFNSVSQASMVFFLNTHKSNFLLKIQITCSS